MLLLDVVRMLMELFSEAEIDMLVVLLVHCSNSSHVRKYSEVCQNFLAGLLHFQLF